jgi:hypothetical protein
MGMSFPRNYKVWCTSWKGFGEGKIKLETLIIWDVSLVDCHHCFGGTCCLHV